MVGVYPNWTLHAGSTRCSRPASPEKSRSLAELAEIDYALPGSVVTRSTRCGKPSCRCKADPPVLHGPYLSWIRKSAGRPITRKLTDEQEQRYRPWFDNSRRLRELVNELQALSIQAIEDAEGWNNRR